MSRASIAIPHNRNSNPIQSPSDRDPRIGEDAPLYICGSDQLEDKRLVLHCLYKKSELFIKDYSILLQVLPFFL